MVSNSKKLLKKSDMKFVGGLFFFKRHSNIFLVLSNYKRQHIVTLTAGNCQLGKNKKKKNISF